MRLKDVMVFRPEKNFKVFVQYLSLEACDVNLSSWGGGGMGGNFHKLCMWVGMCNSFNFTSEACDVIV